MNAAELLDRKIAPLGGGAQSGRPNHTAQELVGGLAQCHRRIVIRGIGASIHVSASPAQPVPAGNERPARIGR